MNEYVVASEEAGLKVVTKFKRETVLALKSQMTITMWWMIKRTFKTEIGRDMFGSEDTLRKELKAGHVIFVQTVGK